MANRKYTPDRIDIGRPQDVFRERIEELLATRYAGVTRRQASMAMGLGENTLQSWLDCDVSPKLETLAGVAKHAGVDFFWLVGAP